MCGATADSDEQFGEMPWGSLFCPTERLYRPKSLSYVTT